MDDVSFELLKLYAQKSKLSIQDISAITNINVKVYAEPILYLVDMKYLRTYDDGNEKWLNIPYTITHAGHLALEAELKKRKAYKYNELRAWITLAIALAAFIKSFFF